MTNAPLKKMYLAGKKLIPEYAETAAGANNWLSAGLKTFDEQCALAGDPKLGKTLLEIGETVYRELHKTVLSMNASALAVVATADDFVRTDEDARSDLDDVRRELEPELQRDGISFDDPTRQASVAPDIGQGELTADGAAPPAAPPGEGRVPSTPDLPDPDVDRDQRNQTERNVEHGNPVPDQPTGGR
jgi:hypothetical protein